MTTPRCVIPGATYAVSRRCLDRRFYLQPGKRMNEIFLYALAAAQQKHGVEIHAFVCMSNHLHLVLTDVRGVLPDFLRDFHREIALAAKVLYRIPETVWSAAKASAIALATTAAVDNAIAYTLLNPVEAGLVAHAAEWPGAISLPGTREATARRPSAWFETSRPKELTVRVTPPPTTEVSEEAWDVGVAKQVADGEIEVAATRAAEGRKRVLGVKRILEQAPFDRPKNGDQLRPNRNPTLAAGGDTAALRAEIWKLRAWRSAYREARARWVLDKTATFPVGTWWVVQRAGAATA